MKKWKHSVALSSDKNPRSITSGVDASGSGLRAAAADSPEKRNGNTAPNDWRAFDATVRQY
jgi:hypothetical protein